MPITKRSAGWRKVYLIFPFAPVVIETGCRVLFGGDEVSALAVPAYSSALVSIMAISVFLHDELNRYRIPDPDEEIKSELTGNRYSMILYFLFSATLFTMLTVATLLIEGQHLLRFAGTLIILRLCTVLMVASFFRHATLLQNQYKLSVL